MNTQTKAGLAGLRRIWQTMQPREQWMVALAIACVTLAGLWWLAIEPAWKTYRTYPAQRQELEQQVQHMQAMRQQALQLQGQMASAAQGAAGDVAAASAALQSSAKALLGPQAQTQTAGERVTVRFDNAAAASVQQWLRETRENTRSQPVQVRLQREVGAESARGTHWSGEIILELPPAAPAR